MQILGPVYFMSKHLVRPNEDTLDQYQCFVEMMAFAAKNVEEADTMDIKTLRARYKTSAMVAKMVKDGVDVFDIGVYRGNV